MCPNKQKRVSKNETSRETGMKGFVCFFYLSAEQSHVNCMSLPAVHLNSDEVPVVVNNEVLDAVKRFIDQMESLILP